jgi:hypothetical protein
MSRVAWPPQSHAEVQMQRADVAFGVCFACAGMVSASGAPILHFWVELQKCNCMDSTIFIVSSLVFLDTYLRISSLVFWLYALVGIPFQF